ncbi:MAG: 23S rRNA (adenine(2503)-C(2))-methyltransferase [Candidatus Handelsmanbacteria bacterium RIFCSPLOWO2_12_FULL_64_10]|uniref:Probable dual-specificity RNA methyltransferase RlmN n=1 Tax=Handelsmanbacteria sp. (strain RIFCSPLOWO2_12_FULL_64_10) TaxID=1817868 RepID=A0A1F6CCX8_HANXR|nr:MAG: 23S rRNA (adenine(2503)-C(2))-methyltransferase [Candidatus Handelsmanbacteria bacterium RIFCSPLOWO2_12_FULL_64_10]
MSEAAPLNVQTADTRVDLKGLPPEELQAFIATLGKERYRTKQLLAWVYGRGATSFDDMTDLSRAFRRELAERARVSQLTEVLRTPSSDGKAVKFLFALSDGLRVESVLMFERNRRTLCISSQVGCPLDCSFCATGKMGLLRNLTAAEIVDQVISVRRELVASGDDLTNIVLMGMGEPLLNYDAVVRAVRLVGLEMGPCLSAKKVTLSTAGHVPGILRLAEDGLKVGLAVSLNATLDDLRTRIMPINRKWPIADLLDAVRRYVRRIGRRVTFEYVLLAGENDADADADRLIALVRGIPCKINLIPYNPIPGLGHQRPSQARIDAFADRLRASHLTVNVRYSKGDDIAAACGQLITETARR